MVVYTKGIRLYFKFIVDSVNLKVEEMRRTLLQYGLSQDFAKWKLKTSQEPSKYAQFFTVVR